MTESNGTEVQKWKGGTVLFAGGTDWSSIGRNIAGKKKGAADAVRTLTFHLLSLFHRKRWADEDLCHAVGGCLPS